MAEHPKDHTGQSDSADCQFDELEMSDDEFEATHVSAPEADQKKRKKRKKRKKKNNKFNMHQNCCKQRRFGKSGKKYGQVFGDDFTDFVNFIENFENRGSSGSEAAAQNLVSVMGSVPAFAVSESMIAQSQAQGMMMSNQVANQQRVNLLGMYTTAKCVGEMLNIHSPTIPTPPPGYYDHHRNHPDGYEEEDELPF